MASVLQCEVMSVDLPFRKPFRHAAATRSSSESLFVRCETDAGTVGFGESLPREYVTGETRDGAFDLLERIILPGLIGLRFESMEDVYAFLDRCDGKAPPGWLDPETPQLAAWCAAELALLDTFGHAFRTPVWGGMRSLPTATRRIEPLNCFEHDCLSSRRRREERAGERRSASTRGSRREREPASGFRYSGVASADGGWKSRWSLLKLRLYGIRDVKLKLEGTNVVPTVRLARRILGSRAAIRVDANMAWNVTEALANIRALSRFNIRCFEQPLGAADLEGHARLVRETDAEVIADEGFTDRASLEELIERRACRGVNVRISKCGGLAASWRRGEEARRAGLVLQFGCQVGESSLLSAAQLVLLGAGPEPKYLEGCYGNHLLQEDPFVPSLQLGRGGRLPALPDGPGLGVRVDEGTLNRWVNRRCLVHRGHPREERTSYVSAR